MQLKYFKIVKPLSVIVLFFFLWTFGGIHEIVHAANSSQNISHQPSAFSSQQQTKTQRPEANFQKTIETIEQILTDTSTDTDTKKNKLITKKSEVENYDVEIRKQFSETEKFLKEKRLPSEILERHYKFVRHYEDNLKELKDNLDNIDKAKTKGEADAAIGTAKAHLEKVKPPKKHVPLDPNKLPHRTAEPVFKEPRTTPQEFLNDSNQQLAISGQPQRQISPNPSLLKRGTNTSSPEDFPTLEKGTSLIPPLEKGGAGGFYGQSSRFTSHPPQRTRPGLGDSRILVASNGPLDGLLSSDPESSPLLDPLPLGERDGVRGVDAPMLLAAATNLPTDADLAETIEVQFTPAIRAKAEELGKNPTKIYNWVRNNIEFVPTYGSIQGADMCLQTKQCNAFDTASLLIALLRVSGIYAHYAYGTIEIPMEKVMNWVGGFTDPMSALNFIASGGIPVGGLTSGGKIVTVRMEHVFVEAWIDYIPSRGEIHRVGDTWIPLDASFKQYSYTQGIDIKSAVPFDEQSFIDQTMANATINETGGYVANVNTLLSQQTMEGYRTSIQNYISQNYPNATGGAVLGKKEIIKHEFSYLLGTLPYRTIVKGATYSSLPDNFRHKITFSVTNNSYDETPLWYLTKSLPELAGKRISLNYLPASDGDAEVLATYGYYSTPPYLANLTPALFIEGVREGTGGTIGMGASHALEITFSSPNISSETIKHPITASALISVGLDTQKITPALLEKRKALLDAALNKIGKEEVPFDDLIGEVLNIHALSYFLTYELFNMSLATGKIAYTKFPAEMAVIVSPFVEYLYGVPYSLRNPNMQVDVKRYVMARKSLRGDRSEEINFSLSSGFLSSTLEHGIFDMLDPEGKAISTVKALSLANDAGIPIYRINASNSATVLQKLHVSPEAIENIKNSVAAGKEIIIPERSVQYYQWIGDGYIVYDPNTGAGDYLISGGLFGASNVCNPWACVIE